MDDKVVEEMKAKLAALKQSDPKAYAAFLREMVKTLGEFKESLKP